MKALVCSQNWLKKYHTINLQEILEEVEKYEDITQGMKGPNLGFLFLTWGTLSALIQIRKKNISFKPFLKVNLMSEPIYTIMFFIKIL